MLLDYRLPDMTGEDLVRRLKDSGSELPFVMMTGQGDEQLAVSIMKLGAAGYLIRIRSSSTGVLPSSGASSNR